MTATLAIDDPVLEAFAREIGPSGPVTVVGGRTASDVGGPADPSAREVRAPAGIVRLEPSELIVAVRAGTPVAELEAELAAVGQRVALPVRSTTATVGGAVVVGRNHPEAFGRGPVRQAVLQIRYVTAEGALSTAGGPTVKNVTGFDLPRLLVGSLGTLGFVGEVLLRTQPTPPERRWWIVADADPIEVRDLAPTCAGVWWDGTSTTVLAEGHPDDVADDRARHVTLGPVTDADGPPPLPAHRQSLTPSGARDLVASGAVPGAVADVGTGLVHRPDPGPTPTLDPLVVALHDRVKRSLDPSGRCNPGRRPW